MSKKIAFFDFDGTITTKDTLLEFIKFYRGPLSFYTGFLLNIHYLIAYKLKIISNQKAKEKILAFFFRRESLNNFTQKSNEFSLQIIPGLIRPKALREIMKWQQLNAEVVIVSASPENWINSWAESTGVSLIATRLEVNEDKLTGKIQGKNCYGLEKVARIKEKYSIKDYEMIVTYGDTSGDLPMLELGTTRFYKPFR